MVDVSRVRELIGDGMTDESAGRVLGVSSFVVWKIRKQHGIQPGIRRPLDSETVRALVEAGKTDPEIAAKLGCHVLKVWRTRKKLGLPTKYDPAQPSDRVRQTRRTSLIERHALMIAKKVERNQRHAKAYGLPNDLTPTQVRIVVALLDGPLPAATIAERLGIRIAGYNSFASSARGKFNLLGDLMSRGLVARVYRGAVGRKGRGSNLYALTLNALNLLSGASP